MHTKLTYSPVPDKRLVRHSLTVELGWGKAKVDEVGDKKRLT